MGINFKTDVGNSSGDFDALPEGRYNVLVDTAEQVTAKTGTEMIKVAFRVEDGDYKNRMLWHNFSLTPKSYVFLYQFLKAAGSTLIDKDDVETPEIIATLPGTKVSAWTEPGVTNSGNPKNDLSRWQTIASNGSADLFS